MARMDDSRRSLIVGATVIGLGILGVVGIGVSQIKGLFQDKTLITADFRQISGLKPGSPVQLEGIDIGLVQDRQFVEVEYPCNPLTEDRGRFAQGRTDDCDRTLFCAPEGKCAELEPYSFNKELHPPCEQDDQCREGEVCVNADFRRRYRRVAWVGSAGMCDDYVTNHKRIRVVMSIYGDRIRHVRDDSRATISQNGVLGDQLIQLSGGRGVPIAAGGAVQTIPAMIEELDNVKDRADGLFDKVEATIGGVAELARAMGDPKTVKDVQNLLANANDVTRRTAEGQGTFGGLINDETYNKDFGAALRNVREGAASLDRGLGNAKAGLNAFEKDLEPAVKQGRDGMAKIHDSLSATRNPESTSTLALLIGDRDGRLTKDVEDTLAGANRLAAGVNAGEGTAGRFLTDPKGYDDLVRFFQGLGDKTAIKILVKWARWKDSRDPRIRRKAD